MLTKYHVATTYGWASEPGRLTSLVSQASQGRVYWPMIRIQILVQDSIRQKSAHGWLLGIIRAKRKESGKLLNFRILIEFDTARPCFCYANIATASVLHARCYREVRLAAESA